MGNLGTRWSNWIFSTLLGGLLAFTSRMFPVNMQTPRNCWRKMVLLFHRPPPGAQPDFCTKFPNHVRVFTFPDRPRQCHGMEMYNHCRDLPACRLNHSPTSNWFTICGLIQQAQHTVDIAAQVITSHRLVDALASLHRAGVRVRILVDQEVMSLSLGTGYFTETLKTAGLAVRMNGHYRGGTLVRGPTLHHKFAVLESQLLLTGSLNFTLHGVLQNYEDVVCTTLLQLVDPYQSHFDEIWDRFDALWC